MNIGVISTVQGYAWAGSEELWYATALAAIAQGHGVSASVCEEMKASVHIQQLSTLGGSIYLRKKPIHPRLASLREQLSPSYKKICDNADLILLSVGSLLDPLYIPHFLDYLYSQTIPYVILCQFNSENLLISPSDRQKLQTFFDTAIGHVFVSKHNLLLARRQLARSLSQATVIYNPIRCPGLEPLPLSSESIIQLGCVARFEILWKGQDVLLEVLQQPQWQARDWHLNLYGSGPDEAYIRQLVDHYSLSQRVTLKGYVRDIQSVWRQNHIMLLASRGEGTPLAVLEAMICGRPTVTTDVGGNREVLNHGDTGFIAEAATVYSFGKALEQAWQQKEQWQQMGLQAHKKAQFLAQSDPSQQLLNYLTALVCR